MANAVGVFTTRATAGPLAFGPDAGDNVLVATLAQRGPSDVPTLITSWPRFLATFGDATPSASGTRFSTGYEVIRRMFDKGVKRMHVLRVIGADALEAYTDLVDRAGVPLDTLRVFGKGEGTWANSYDVVVADGTRADTFKLTVLDGDGKVVDGEVWDNLKMNDAALERLNNGSSFIRVSNLNSVTAAPLNRPATGTFSLGTDQAGVDDNDLVAADIVGTEAVGVKTGLKAFRSGLYGRGFIIAPDLDTDSAVRDELIAQSEAYYRVPLFSSSEGDNVAAVIADVPECIAFNGGYYYPRAKVQDVLTDEYKTIPVTGHIIADWLKAIAQTGPGKAPAGKDFKIDFVLGIESQSNGMPLIDAGVAESLLAVGINPIWDRTGNGPRCWGARSTSDEAAWQYMHAGYLWCRIGHAVQGALDELVYDIADDLFFSQVEGGIRSYLSDLTSAGAFRGRVPLPTEDPDPDTHAFGVVADESLLSDSDKNNGIVRAELWFRPAGVAETIYVKVAKRNE